MAIEAATEQVLLESESLFLEPTLIRKKILFRNYKQGEDKMKMPRITNTIEEISCDYNKAKENPNVFYAQSFLNRNGCLLNSDNNKVTISNQIAEWMLSSNPLSSIKKIDMPKDMTYLIEWHSGNPTTETKNSNREEELVAMSLFKKKVYPHSDIDCFIDYQVPIYRGHEHENEHIGKIDLVAISHKNHKVLLMELKKHSSDETLLRCVSEIYTYYKQIDSEKLKKEISERPNNNAILEYEVVPAVLVFKNQRQHTQYTCKNYDKVKELMKDLGVSMYVIDSTMKFDSKQYAAYIEQCCITNID